MEEENVNGQTLNLKMLMPGNRGYQLICAKEAATAGDPAAVDMIEGWLFGRLVAITQRAYILREATSDALVLVPRVFTIGAVKVLRAYRI